MAKKEKDFCGCDCCKVESMVSVDERGQLVLPKVVREKADIKAGDKLAVISMERRGKNCVVVLIKAENLEDMVKEFLGPVTKEIMKK